VLLGRDLFVVFCWVEVCVVCRVEVCVLLGRGLCFVG
jgi:hypothetical protein